MSDHPINIAEITKRLGGHSIFAPSSGKMWAYCSGSLLANIYAKDEAGIDAAYGTVGHQVGQEWLETGERPLHLIGNIVEVVEPSDKFEIEIDWAMLDYVEKYVDWCIYLPGSHFVETRVSISDLTPIPNQTGTADHAACELHKLTITDLKMGLGVRVFAKENIQAILYAYGFFQEYDWLYDFQQIIIRIAQPRLDHFDEWTITRAELLRWADWLKTRAHAAWVPNAPRTPGVETCQWCKVKADCVAHVVFTSRLLDGVFDDGTEAVTEDEMAALTASIDQGSFQVSPTPVGQLSLDQKIKLLPYRKMVESWWNALYEDLKTRCLNGEHVPGMKLVTGKTNREYTDKEAAAQHLMFLGMQEDVVFKKTLITPAAAEEELRKIGYKRKALPNLLKPVVRKPPGKPTMAPDIDDRQAVSSLADQSFEYDDL